MNAHYVFAYLARQANEIWGPAATPSYIFKEIDQGISKARREEIESLKSLTDSCSLSQHPLVVAHRTKKARRKQAKEFEAMQREAMIRALTLRLLQQ